jgi:hypothetical protein
MEIQPLKPGDRFLPEREHLSGHGRTKKAGLPPGFIATEGAEKVTISARLQREGISGEDISNVQDLAPILRAAKRSG